MPWQSAGALTVSIAMFNVVPLLVGGIQYLGHGKPKELGLPGNEWNYRMVKRDDQYEKYAAEIRKSMDATKS